MCLLHDVAVAQILVQVRDEAASMGAPNSVFRGCCSSVRAAERVSLALRALPRVKMLAPPVRADHELHLKLNSLVIKSQERLSKYSEAS
jgi:hypothetical protein